jgi:membrane fusion protein, heavy metal efflux system
MSESPREDNAAQGQARIDRRAWSTARQWRVAAIAAVALILIILALRLCDRLLAPQAAPAAAPPSPGTFRATPEQLQALTIETVQMHGFVGEEVTQGKIAVNGDRETQVFSPYSGRVTQVIAAVGASVRAGEALAALEASEFVQAQTELKSAAAQVKLARLNESRKHALYDVKGGSLQDWQQAQADLSTAETAVDAVRNRLGIFGKSAADISTLENAPALSARASLNSPIAGVVVDRQVGRGQYVQAGGGTALFTVADLSSVWLLANVRESDAGLVMPGQRVEVRVLAYPKRVFTARVTFVSALVDPATHRLPVRAEIDNADGVLKPEMFAQFRILTSDSEQSPGIAQAAVVYEGDAAHVWVLSGSDLLSLRRIRTARSDGNLIEVPEGLTPGERVVTRGALFIDQAAAPASP